MAWLVSLLWMNPGLCVGVDGLEKVKKIFWFLKLHVGGFARGEGISVLMGHMCCLLHWYVLSCASIMYDLDVLAGPEMVPSKYE